MVLTGTEVKAAKSGKMQLKESYGAIEGNEAWLLNAHISEYSHGNRANHEPARRRKLLLHRNEIAKLLGKTREKGLSLVPTKVYLKEGRIKCELAVARGKPEAFTAATLRRAAGTALRHLKSKSARDIAMLLDSSFAGPEHVAAAVEGAILGDYEPDVLKSDKTDVKIVDRFTVVVPGGDAALEEARRRGEIIAESQNLTRELV